MSDGMIGFGTTIEVETTPGVWFKLGFVNDVNPPDDSTDDVDVTHMESPGRRRQYIAGLIDGGEGSFGVNWIPGNPTDEYVRAWRATGENRDLRLTYPNNVTETFPTYPKGWSKAVPLDDKMTATLTVKMAGDIEYGVAA